MARFSCNRTLRTETLAALQLVLLASCSSTDKPPPPGGSPNDPAGAGAQVGAGGEVISAGAVGAGATTPVETAGMGAVAGMGANGTVAGMGGTDAVDAKGAMSGGMAAIGAEDGALPGGQDGEGEASAGESGGEGTAPMDESGSEAAAPIGESGGEGAAPIGGQGAGSPASGDFCLNPGNGDFNQNGPYQVATEDVSIGSSGMYTIFYPTEFEADCLHPIVAWGNGTAVTGSEVYGFLNDRAASWGIVAIASHNSNVGSGTFHRDAIDYLLAENENPDSKHYQHLSGRVGVSGHSQGGFGAQQASSHPNVQALVAIGASGEPSASHAYLCISGTADIAPDSCSSSAQSAPGPAMAAIWEGGDHVGTQTLAGWVAGDEGTYQMTRLYAAWLRCFLADDPVSCGLFDGGNPSCTICTDPGWAEVITNNL